MSHKSTAVQMAPETSPLILVGPPTIFEQLNRTYEEIARRAFEIFESDGKPLGHDLEHWFKAESELLHPVHIDVQEADDTLTVTAEVPGFSANELEISLEPKRLTLIGKKERKESRKNAKAVYKENCSSEILRVIDLPVEVDADKAVATLKNGVLELELPKAASTKMTRIEVKQAA